MALSVWAGITEFPLPSPRDGTNGDVITVNNNQYILSAGGGGGGTPASPTNSIQFNNAGSFGGSSNLTFDGSLETITANSLGVTQDLSKGLKLVNTTAAAAGAQQISPAIHWSANGWKTASTAASQSVDFYADVLPVQGSTNPSARWRLRSSINGGAYSDLMLVNSTGSMSFTGGIIASTNIRSPQYQDSSGNVTIDDNTIYYPSQGTLLADSTSKLYAQTSLNFTSFTNSSPSNGQIWYDGTHVKTRLGGTTYQLDQQGGASVSGTNGAVQIANSGGTALDHISGLNWDSSNSRLAIPAFAVSGDAQFVGNPRFLQQTTDGTLFFAGSSGSDHGYLTSDGTCSWNNTLKMFVPGNPSSPAARVHSLGNYLTVGDPTSFTATLTLESLTAVTPTDTLTLVYQPIAPTYYGQIDPTSGLPTDALQSLGSGGFTCNGQTITGTVYSGRTLGGQSFVDPVGYATSFIDYVNDGTTPFSLTWYWQPQANSDGSTPDFQIFVENTTGFIYYISNGSGSTFSDSANDPGSVPTYSTFTGFTASGQMLSYDIAGQADSPSGQPYYSSSANYPITDTVNNGSLFQVQHQVGSASGNWKISQGFNQCQGGANNFTFYQSVTFSNGGDLTPLHYGFLSDGSTLNRDFTITTRNISPLEYYSTGSLDAPTTDNNDGFYYSITYVYNLPAAGQGIRATESINGGAATYKDVTGNSGTFYQDALGAHFLGATPLFSPTYRSLPGVIAENTSDSTFRVPCHKFKATNANAEIGWEMYEQNVLKASQYHLQSGNYEFMNSNGAYDFITLNSSGPTINFKNSSGTVIAGINGTGDLTINQININDAKNIVVGTSTGTKIGTATTQKIGFYNATPIVQPTGNIVTALSNLGLVGTPTLPASSVTSGAALTKTDDTNVTLTLGGTPATALLTASSLTLGWTGTLSVARGGTGSAIQFVDNVSLTNQSADITATNFTHGGTAGLYRVSYSLQDTTSDITAGAVTLTLAYTDGGGAATTTATQVLTGTGRTTGSVYIQLASGNITYAVAHTGIFGTAKFAVFLTLERLL